MRKKQKREVTIDSYDTLLSNNAKSDVLNIIFTLLDHGDSSYLMV